MIDCHIEESMRKKICAYEYVDFSKLIPKSRTGRDDEGQRLEIVNRNGVSYLSPIADRESISITGYNRWEQAFRIYSNILTSNFPSKAPELLQYNHTIYSASTSYVWDNVYNYDKEFRHHIARHPYQLWGIILQQAWTMILKDRIRYDNHGQRGSGAAGKNFNKKGAEPCRRFNKGHCTYGLSCKFDHRCSVKKCGKFSHGAHQCRLKSQEESDSTSVKPSPSGTD